MRGPGSNMVPFLPCGRAAGPCPLGKPHVLVEGVAHCCPRSSDTDTGLLCSLRRCQDVAGPKTDHVPGLGAGGGGSHPLAASVGPLLHPLWPFCPALLLFSRLHAALMGTAWKTMLYHEFPSTCFLSGPSRSALCQARKWENSTNSQLPLHSQGRAI